MALANLSIYYTCKNVKSAHSNNKFKISATTWNEEFDLPDGSYSIPDIQNYIEYIIKKHETIANDPPVQIYVNKIKNRTVFKIKIGYKLELLSPETMKLLGNRSKIVDQNKDGEDEPKSESVEVVLVQCNLGNTNYQQASKVLFTFVPNKKFGQLITIAPHSLTMLIQQIQNFHPLKYGLLIKNYSKTAGRLWNYYRDEPNSGTERNINYPIRGSKSFDYKTSITGKLEGDNTEEH